MLVTLEIEVCGLRQALKRNQRTQATKPGYKAWLIPLLLIQGYRTVSCLDRFGVAAGGGGAIRSRWPPKKKLVLRNKEILKQGYPKSGAFVTCWPGRSTHFHEFFGKKKNGGIKWTHDAEVVHEGPYVSLNGLWLQTTQALGDRSTTEIGQNLVLFRTDHISQ
jgi:hypothetical protein